MRLGLFLALVLVSRAALGDSYSLIVDPATPLKGQLTVSFDPPTEPNTTLGARSLPTTSSAAQPWCIEPRAKLARADVYWIVPDDCAAVSWAVEFVEVGDDTYPVSRQENIFHPDGWWVMSEWGSLLRRTPNGGAVICAHIGKRKDSCGTVPRIDQPPLLLAFGRPSRAQKAGGLTFRLFSDRAERLMDIARVFSTFGHQLEYLTEIARQPTTRLQNAPLDIVWLGIDPSHGLSNGAGGSQSILANYVTNDSGDQVVAVEQFRLLWVSGHEILHLLGMNTNAIWASESLPTYYSFKSFIGLPEETMATDFLAQMERESNESVGLLKAQRLVAEGNGQYMAVVYAKGAVFWRKLDEGIQEASEGTLELDDLLHALYAEPFSDAGMLPPSFSESIRKRLPEFEYDEVVGEYL